MSKIPDYVIFGIDSSGNPIDYGFVRTITDDNELIELLNLRLKVFFVNQVQPLQDAKSPFPLTIMTCVGIETLAEIFVKRKEGDQSFRFVETLKQMHQKFSHKPNGKFKQKLKEIWLEKELSNLDSFAKITYQFFRNTMMHGYQGKGVFLSYGDTVNIEINDELAFIKLNPDWFWNRFKEYYEKLFTMVKLAQTNNPEKQNCIQYIKNNLLE
jgi:hypothetical protein